MAAKKKAATRAKSAVTTASVGKKAKVVKKAAPKKAKKTAAKKTAAKKK